MLHLVNKSPFERRSMESCLRFAAKGSAILLYEDGVVAGLKGTAFADLALGMAKHYRVYALVPDLAARGFSESQLVEGITPVGYDGFVDLVAENGPVQSWV